MSEAKIFFCAAAFMGLLGVMGGAIGAHAVKPGLTPADVSSYDTAIVYLFVHVLALLVVALVLHTTGEYWLLRLAGYAFVGGVVLFSGSILARLAFEVSFSVPLAPAGGILLMLGWAALFIVVLLSW